MCRLFGFRSDAPARVHHALVTEPNSLRLQSQEHKDGWGIAFYPDEAGPQLAKGLEPAHQDPEYERISNQVSARTVLAHVRLASIGPVAAQNAHPFVHGRWSFAHNGTVRDFERHREAIEARIAPELRGLIRGETDSERCFYLFLTELGAHASAAVPLEDVARALARTALSLLRLTEAPDGDRTSTNFLASDGRRMLATRRGRTLSYWQDGREPRQVVIASERLFGDAGWQELGEESVIGVDEDLCVRLWRFDELVAPA
jgi:predicted glutamine amidotransferase